MCRDNPRAVFYLHAQEYFREGVYIQMDTPEIHSMFACSGILRRGRLPRLSVFPCSGLLRRFILCLRVQGYSGEYVYIYMDTTKTHNEIIKCHSVTTCIVILRRVQVGPNSQGHYREFQCDYEEEYCQTVDSFRLLTYVKFQLIKSFLSRNSSQACYPAQQ